jgi:cytochrome c biogenesis protein CcmG/thiol:disulfide interchange protein DsbE
LNFTVQKFFTWFERHALQNRLQASAVLLEEFASFFASGLIEGSICGIICVICALAKSDAARHRHTMRHRVCITLAGLAAAFTVCADVNLPMLQVGHEVYSNVTVWSQSPTDIYFNHARGMGNAKLKDLSPDLQKRFGYDPVKAGESEKKRIEANVAYRKEVLRAKPAAVRAPAAAQTSGETVTAGDIPVREISARSFRGRLAPEFVVEKWLTAKPDLAGKFLLIDFWATWCGPCRRSIPELNTLHAKFKDQLVIVGLSDESEEDVRRMTSPKIDYYVAIDTSSKMKDAVEVRGIPHAILLDPNGIVRFEGHPGYLSAKGVAGLLAKYSN